jgi:hypothetical protein
MKNSDEDIMKILQVKTKIRKLNEYTKILMRARIIIRKIIMSKKDKKKTVKFEDISEYPKYSDLSFHDFTAILTQVKKRVIF